MTPATPERDIVLLCNPRAGGKWKELAKILDSPETQHVHWIVTDSIRDIGPALGSLGSSTKLVCIYGGDGTIQRILDHMFTQARRADQEGPQLAFIGGGTMNVTASWCGMSRSPQRNFRDVVRRYLGGELLTKEVPLLRVEQGGVVRHCFTFGMGPMIRVLNEYEQGRKGKLAAVGIAAKAVTATLTKKPADFEPVLRPLFAEVVRDGEPLPERQFAAIFANITGRLLPLVDPYTKVRSRETFYFLAYAVNNEEVALWLPFLARGRLPVQPAALIKPIAGWKQIAMSYLGQDSFPVDPRYINRLARRLDIRTEEPIYTVDGEVIESTGDPIGVDLGPTLRLAMGPGGGKGPPALLGRGVKPPDDD